MVFPAHHRLPKPTHGRGILMSLWRSRTCNDIGCSYHPNSFGERFHWYTHRLM